MTASVTMFIKQCLLLLLVTIATLRETNDNWRHQTFSTHAQWFWGDAHKIVRRQRPAMGAGRGVLWVATLVIRVIISLSILGRTSLNALYHGKMIIASESNIISLSFSFNKLDYVTRCQSQTTFIYIYSLFPCDCNYITAYLCVTLIE